MRHGVMGPIHDKSAVPVFSVQHLAIPTQDHLVTCQVHPMYLLQRTVGVGSPDTWHISLASTPFPDWTPSGVLLDTEGGTEM